MRRDELFREVSMLNLLTEIDVAERLQVSLASVRRWRLAKRGPIFVKVGALVRYRPEDLESWIVALPKGGLEQAGQPEHIATEQIKIQYSSGL
jgi:hypothetical protein